MTLKEIRKNCKLTQKEASEIIKMPLRTYVAYETDEKKADQIKLEGIKDRLMEYAAKDVTILKDKVLLITGGTGSFGHAVVDRFLDTILKKFAFFHVTKRNKMICVSSITIASLNSILAM